MFIYTYVCTEGGHHSIHGAAELPTVLEALPSGDEAHPSVGGEDMDHGGLSRDAADCLLLYIRIMDMRGSAQAI